MLEYAVFWAIAAALGVSMLFVFRSRNMLHVMIGFSLVFVVGAVVFFMLNLPLLALLQLFIMVGGVSTYVFVGVSSESLSGFRHTSIGLLALLMALLIAMPLYRIGGLQIGSGANTLSNGIIAASMGSDMGLFYMIALMLFGIGVGSIIIMRRRAG